MSNDSLLKNSSCDLATGGQNGDTVSICPSPLQTRYLPPEFGVFSALLSRCALLGAAFLWDLWVVLGLVLLGACLRPTLCPPGAPWPGLPRCQPLILTNLQT